MTRRTQKRKRPRGSRAPSKRNYHDLNVPLPTKNSGRKVMFQSLLDRLSDTNYKTVALTHTVYGKVDPERDAVDQVFPMLLQSEDTKKAPDEERQREVKETSPNTVSSINTENGKITILKRINIVIEEISNVSFYTATSSSSLPEPLSQYDIVSIAPRTDAIFSMLQKFLFTWRIPLLQKSSHLQY